MMLIYRLGQIAAWAWIALVVIVASGNGSVAPSVVGVAIIPAVALWLGGWLLAMMIGSVLRVFTR